MLQSRSSSVLIFHSYLFHIFHRTHIMIIVVFGRSQRWGKCLFLFYFSSFQKRQKRSLTRKAKKNTKIISIRKSVYSYYSINNPSLMDPNFLRSVLAFALVVIKITALMRCLPKYYFALCVISFISSILATLHTSQQVTFFSAM